MTSCPQKSAPTYGPLHTSSCFPRLCILLVAVPVKGGARKGAGQLSRAGRFGLAAMTPASTCPRLPLLPRPALWPGSLPLEVSCPLGGPGSVLNRISYRYTDTIHNGNKTAEPVWQQILQGSSDHCRADVFPDLKTRFLMP